jgi:putative ABC transport system permease protein
VFFDLQPDQKSDVEAIIRGQGLGLQPAVPIVPMRLSAINGKSVASLIAADTLRSKEGERPRRGEEPRQGGGPAGWALRREYRSTYRDTAVASEKVVVGDWWSRGAKSSPVPISMEAGVASDLNVTLRDTLTWDIQGVPVVTVIKNLREVNWARFEPLNDAPQSFVLLTRVDDPAAMGRLQRAVVEKHPNVTSIDLTSIQRTIEKIVASVVLAIQFMALFSVSTGVVVLIGALATSRFQRIRESALLKTLGATRRQVVGVMVTEYAALGILAALVAVVLASLGGWALTKWVFKIPFTVPWGAFGLLALLTATLTVITGLWTSISLFRQSALEVLRAE